jgi:hypothetical protein
MFMIKIKFLAGHFLHLKFYFATIVSVPSTLLSEMGRIRKAQKHTDPDPDPEHC